jgi:hypothetical protein
LQFGIWANCGRLTPDASTGCTSNGLGYQQTQFQPLVANIFTSKLPYALIVQPISALIAALATIGALLNLCFFSIFWVLLAILSVIASAAALAIELALFVPAKNKFDNGSYSVDAANAAFAGGAALSGGADYSRISNTKLGAGIWIQVGALAASLIGAIFIIAAYATSRSSRRKEKEIEFDFEPTNGAHAQRYSEYYNEQQAADAAAARDPHNPANRKSKRFTWLRGGGYSVTNPNDNSQDGAYYDDEGYYVPDGGQGYDQPHEQQTAAAAAAAASNGEHSGYATNPHQQQYAQQQPETSSAHQHHSHNNSGDPASTQYHDTQYHDANYYAAGSNSQHAAQQQQQQAQQAAGGDPRYQYGGYNPAYGENQYTGQHQQEQQGIITPGPAAGGAKTRWSQEGAY